MTIAVLAPYQRCGVGSELLAEVLQNITDVKKGYHQYAKAQLFYLPRGTCS